MKLYAPNTITWITGVVFGIIGVVGHFTSIEFITERSATFMTIGLLLLAIGPLVVKKK